MKGKEKLIKVRTLGNVGNYEAGQEIEVSEPEAVRLLSLGYAKIVEAPAEAKE